MTERLQSEIPDEREPHLFGGRRTEQLEMTAQLSPPEFLAMALATNGGASGLVTPAAQGIGFAALALMQALDDGRLVPDAQGHRLSRGPMQEQSNDPLLDTVVRKAQGHSPDQALSALVSNPFRNTGIELRDRCLAGLEEQGLITRSRWLPRVPPFDQWAVAKAPTAQAIKEALDLSATSPTQVPGQAIVAVSVLHAISTNALGGAAASSSTSFGPDPDPIHQWVLEGAYRLVSRMTAAGMGFLGGGVV